MTQRWSTEATHLLSQMTALRSRWLVGSSSISSVGSMNNALRRNGGQGQQTQSPWLAELNENFLLDRDHKGESPELSHSTVRVVYHGLEPDC